MFQNQMNSSKLAFKNNYNMIETLNLMEACWLKQQQLFGSLIWQMRFIPGSNQMKVRTTLNAKLKTMTSLQKFYLTKMRKKTSLIPRGTRVKLTKKSSNLSQTTTHNKTKASNKSSELPHITRLNVAFVIYLHDNCSYKTYQNFLLFFC